LGPVRRRSGGHVRQATGKCVGKHSAGPLLADCEVQSCDQPREVSSGLSVLDAFA